MKNVIFLYNPVSGEAQIVAQLDRIAMYYQRAGYVLTLFRITRERGLSNLSALIGTLRPDHLLAAGGDGTINRLVNYLRHRDVTIPIAILPMGTANDFAHLIGMPNNLTDACRAILNGKVQYLDMGRVNNRYFINVLSCGLFTEVSQKTPTALKNTFGKLAYYFSSIGELPSFRKMNIEVTADEISFKGSCLLLLVFNGRTAGNFKLARHSSAEDGLLDVLIIKGENIVESIKNVFHFLMKKRDSAYPSDIVYFQTRKLHIENDQPTTDIDGEKGPDFPLDIECLPGSLPIIVPQETE
ncbi:MAG: YegS/Rv2252/BmrU family lipid kinase [Rikenellaceae bacterium]|nr:YegS/Rv2252/BmrU family lipid kinase [Rikenellaceae bacterium]